MPTDVTPALATLGALGWSCNEDFIPKATSFSLSDMAPVSETVGAAPGAGMAASRDDHKHPRLTSATNHALGSTSTVTVTFTRTFAVPPCVACLLIEAASSQPVTFKVESWVMGTGAQSALYVGAVIRGYRGALLPALSGILLIGPLISALSSFNPFGGDANGAQFCCLAVMPSN